jgi:hypothetical protein
MPGLTPVGEVLRRHGRLQIFYCRMLVAEQPDLSGKHQRQILPEHGPGAFVRTARQPASRRGALAAVPAPRPRRRDSRPHDLRSLNWRGARTKAARSSIYRSI